MGFAECLQAHRGAEGQLPRLSAMQGAEGLKERLLRLEGSSALKEGAGKCGPHAKDPGDPRQEPKDLRLPEGACRA
jgi:hypothetical protein